MTKTASHREGVWKQSNKVHKTGQHRSKGAVKNSINGKVGKSGGGGGKNKKITKMARKNAALALRTKKENEAIRAYRPTHMIMFPLGQEKGLNFAFSEKIEKFLQNLKKKLLKISNPKIRKIITYTKCWPIVAK